MIQYINFKYETLEECTQKTNELVLMYKEIINTEIIKDADGWSTILKLDIQNEFEMFKGIELKSLELVCVPIEERHPVGMIGKIFKFNVVEVNGKKNSNTELEIMKNKEDVNIIFRYLQNDIDIYPMSFKLMNFGKKYCKVNIRKFKLVTKVWDRFDLSSEELDGMSVKEINEKHIQMMNNHITNGLLQLGILLDTYSKDELEYRVRQVIEALMENRLNEF